MGDVLGRVFMPEDVALIRAVTRCGAEDAEALLERAQALGIDPLEFARSRLWLHDEVVYARAAQWADLAFSAVVPESARFSAGLARIEGLAHVRSLRLHLLDRDILFVAPRFAQFVALRAHGRANPDMKRRVCVVPPQHLRHALAERSTTERIDFARQNLARKWPFATAHLELGLPVRLGFVLGLFALLLTAVVAPFEARPVLVPLLFVLLVLPSWFRIAAIIDEPAPGEARRAVLASDAELPVYSVLVPLRDEAHMVPQLVETFRRFDYPIEKLDIKFVVEAESPATIAAVKRSIPGTGFELITVPPAQPHTKPKALNFALPLVRGDFVVVYDAEDIPEPDQLRRTASLFLKSPDLGCIQAELVPDNAEENALTALFASEYGGQFGIMLPGLVHWGFPMPLGGTSNHFRIGVLTEIGGWDAFNVTEDADLGLRLARRGVRKATITSRTYEEAPVTVPAWFRQRTRWMKGWMQTFMVHNRHPIVLLRDLGLFNFLALQIYVAGMILTPPLHTLYVAGVLVRLCLSSLHAPGMDPLSLIETFTLVIGYLSAIFLAIFGLIHLGRTHLIKYQLLLPFYWALMGLASFRAAYDLVRNPYFWSKTRHGVSKLRRNMNLDETEPTHNPAAAPTLAWNKREMERVKGIEPSS